MTPRLRTGWLVDVSAVVLLAVAARLALGAGALGYDAAWALVWGRDLVSGEMPNLETAVAPTPHPLSNGISTALAWLGTSQASSAIMALSWISLGALVWSVARLGAHLFSWPVGLLAAAIVGTRAIIAEMTTGALVDVPFLALVVWAAVLEVQRPRERLAVPALLLVAGLLRPEAWMLALAYAAYVWLSGARADTKSRIVLAVGAPLVWAVADLTLTGDPLHSLQGTQALAGQLDRPRGLRTAVETAPRYLVEALQRPAAWLAFGGLIAAAVRWRKSAVLPVTLIGLGLLTFLGLGIAGLPLLDRYLLLPTIMLALFCGVAALGWTAMSRDDPARRRWLIGGLTAAALVAAGVPQDARRLDEVRAFVDLRNLVREDLRAATSDPDVVAAARVCGPVTVHAYRARPHVILWLERPESSVVLGQGRGRASSVVLSQEPDAYQVEGARRLYRGVSWSATAVNC